MSLRLRLTLLAVALFLLGTAVVSVRALQTAQRTLQTELELAALLTEQIVTLTAQGASTQPGNDEFSQQLTEQLSQLQTNLRVGLSLHQAGRPLQTAALQSAQHSHAPAWFVALLALDPALLQQQFMAPDGTLFSIGLWPDTALAEIWADTRIALLARLGFLLLITAVFYFSIAYWLKPVQQMVAVLDSVVRGDFSRRIAPISSLELDEIAQKINFVATVLGASKVDNDRLNRKALSVQEQERRYLAQELHDSLGQSVSAIKAMAVSIAMRTQDSVPAVADSARHIENISDKAYDSVRNLMAWLRPAVLDELGLPLALQQMVDEWNQHHEDTFCRLRLDDGFADLGEQQQIQLYRIVQEALTNVAKHAHASTVSVVLSGQAIATLIISDDGQGFDQDQVRLGIGLSSIRDRVNLLRGTLVISSKPGQGTTLQIEFPRQTSYRRHHDDDGESDQARTGR